MEITVDNLWSFFRDNHIKYADMRLLSEAFRRKHFINPNGVAVTSGWVGLGTYAVYGKSKYFKDAHNTTEFTPRINYWWKLTDEGLDVMSKIESSFSIPTDHPKRDEVNTMLFTF